MISHIKKGLATILIAASLSSCTIYNHSYKKHYEKRIEETSNINVYLDTETIYKTNSNDTTKIDTLKTLGRGFVFRDYIFTLYHVTTKNHITKNTPFGNFKYKINKLNEKTFLDDIELYSVVEDSTTDIAIFDLKKTPKLREKYANNLKLTDIIKSDELYQGMRVFFNGNPHNFPGYYNEAIIRKVEADTKESETELGNSFMINQGIIPGTSGTPIWNYNGKNNKIVGVAQYTTKNIGGVKYIDDYIKEIEIYEKNQQLP